MVVVPLVVPKLFQFSADIETFGHSLGMEPGDGVPNLPPCILDVAVQAMERSRTTEGKKIGPRLAATQELLPDLDWRHRTIPVMAHELEAIGWVAENAVIGRAGKG